MAYSKSNTICNKDRGRPHAQAGPIKSYLYCPKHSLLFYLYPAGGIL